MPQIIQIQVDFNNDPRGKGLATVALIEYLHESKQRSMKIFNKWDLMFNLYIRAEKIKDIFKQDIPY